MEPKVELFQEDDAIYIRLKESTVTSGKDREGDPARHLDFDEFGELVGVLFMNISNGVDLDVLPDDVQEAVNAQLLEYSIPVLA